MTSFERTLCDRRQERRTLGGCYASLRFRWCGVATSSQVGERHSLSFVVVRHAEHSVTVVYFVKTPPSIKEHKKKEEEKKKLHGRALTGESEERATEWHRRHFSFRLRSTIRKEIKEKKKKKIIIVHEGPCVYMFCLYFCSNRRTFG